MNNHWNVPPLSATAPVGEVLLAETAIRIELPPSLHRLAVERYEAIRKHIERPDSPLCDLVVWFYPQGSMAIRATIKAKRREDGFDIDIVAELMLPRSTKPSERLDLLFKAINGPVGSQYHGMVERQSRCVTVHYADGMHLDITPSELVDERDPRRSYISHANPKEVPEKHYLLVMNSWAFCEWFIARTPTNLIFEQAYAKRAMALDSRRVVADAAVKPVPGHSTLEDGKSSAVVALQLLKRNRNIRYASRDGRMPPSVMMAKFAGEAAVPSGSISGALEVISDTMLSALEEAERNNTIIDVRNPMCGEDRFSDRWPENRAAQRTYIQDLKLLRKQLAELMSEELTLPEKRDLLVAMFGEGPAQSAIDEYAARIGHAVRQGERSIAPSGKVIPTAGVVASSTISAAFAQPRPHTFFGSRWTKE